MSTSTVAGRAGARTRPTGATALTRASGLGLGVSVLWFSLLVLIPLAAVIATAAAGGWGGFWREVTNPQTAHAIRLTVTAAASVTAINVLVGTVIAWVLVRDSFPGRSVLNVMIDIPFALPTIVAGLVLVSLYGIQSPLGIHLANTSWSVYLAFAFVTLPFVVRAVQPVLEELDLDVEEAAASLGASRFTTFRRIVLPSLAPAIAAGAALSFARGVSEYGSLVLLSGNLPFTSEVTSVRILAAIENDNTAGAAATATVLLVISLAVIVFLDVLQRRVARRAHGGEPDEAQEPGHAGRLTAHLRAALAKHTDGDPSMAAAIDVTSYASWRRRVVAYLVDALLGLAIFVCFVAVAFITPSSGHGFDVTLYALGSLSAVAWWVWDGGIVSGRTGQSFGKRVTHIAVVHATTGRAIGPWAGVGRLPTRELLGSVTARVSQLWPLWDRRRRALHDLTLGTVVVNGGPAHPAVDVARTFTLPSPAVVRRRRATVRWILRLLALTYVFFLVAWPVSLVATNAFANGFDAFVRIFGDTEFTVALRLTIIAAIAATVVNTVFGIGISLLIVRKDFRGKRVLNALLDVPLSVSPIVVGLALVLVYGTREGWLGPTLSDAGIQIIWALPGIVLATAFVSLPLVIREVVPVLREIGTEQEQAALSLGASSWQSFWRITLPAIRWGVVYGVVLTLARSLGEFGAVKVVSGNVSGQTRTATLVVEERYLNFDTEAAYAISFILASVSVISIIAVTILRARDARLHH